jgi:DNA-binding response OmpR family regulator
MLAFEPARDRGAFKSADRRILVVEDDFFVGIMTQEALSNAGFVVIGIATDAEQAIALASKQLPHLVVMDIRLAHGDDGVDTAIAILRKFNIRSIFVTAHSDDATRSRANAARPLGWLEKPFRLDALVATVINALAAAERENGGGPGVIDGLP